MIGARPVPVPGALAVALTLALVAAIACAPPAPLDVARVAVVAPLSGDQAADGRAVADGVRLAVEEWNAAGGVHGLRLEVVTIDGAQPGVARRFAADPRIVMVVAYPGLAPDAAAIGPEADAPAVVELGAGARTERSPGVVRLAPPPEQVARIAAAAIAYNFGPTTVAIVASGTPAAITEAQSFARAAPARGLRVVANVTLANLETGYGRVADTLRRAAPAIIYVAGRGYDAGALWSELRPRDSRTRLVLGPGVRDEGFARTGRGFFDGVLALELFVRPEDAPGAAAFDRRFDERFGHQPSVPAARGYDAAALGLRAVASATDGAALGAARPCAPRRMVRACCPACYACTRWTARPCPPGSWRCTA
ncbi:MAG: ABC transporter substrate-binding protein [Dehalococcoidia bacterium]